MKAVSAGWENGASADGTGIAGAQREARGAELRGGEARRAGAGGGEKERSRFGAAAAGERERCRSRVGAAGERSRLDGRSRFEPTGERAPCRLSRWTGDRDRERDRRRDGERRPFGGGEWWRPFGPGSANWRFPFA